MFNLYQIVTGAQGGQALDNLAQRFGLSREQADSAVKAIVPALSTAFMTKAAQPGGMQEIAGAMSDDHHKQAYADPDTANAPATQQKGGDIAGSIFGNIAMVQQVIEQASRYTGIPQATLQQMLPVIVSMVLGGVATAMHNQGLGGILGQLANSGFGGMLGGGAAGQQPGAGGGLGGMFGSILGSMFGGGQHGEAAQPGQPAPGQASPGQTSPGQSGQAGVPACRRRCRRAWRRSARCSSRASSRIRAWATSPRRSARSCPASGEPAQLSLAASGE